MLKIQLLGVGMCLINYFKKTDKNWLFDYTDQLVLSRMLLRAWLQA